MSRVPLWIKKARLASAGAAAGWDFNYGSGQELPGTITSSQAAQHNLIPYSEDATYWTTTTSASVVYNGTYSRITDDSSTASRIRACHFTVTWDPDQDYTVSIYLKEGTSTGTRILLYEGAGSLALVTITWGTHTANIGTLTDMGDGLYQWKYSWNASTTGDANFALYIYPTYLSSLTETGYVDLYGAQLEIGSDSTDYEKTVNGIVSFDYSGQLGSTTGTDTEDPAWEATGISFAGGDYIVLPSNVVETLNGASAITIDLVAKRSAPNVDMDILHFRQATDSTKLELLFDNNALTINVRSNAVETLQTKYTGECFTDEACVHYYQVIVDIANDTISLYQDNILYPSTGTISFTETAIADTTAQDATIGANGGYTNTYGGTIYYLRIYNRALSNRERQLNQMWYKQKLAMRSTPVLMSAKYTLFDSASLSSTTLNLEETTELYDGQEIGQFLSLICGIPSVN